MRRSVVSEQLNRRSQIGDGAVKVLAKDTQYGARAEVLRLHGPCADDVVEWLEGGRLDDVTGGDLFVEEVNVTRVDVVGLFVQHQLGHIL